MSDAVVAHEEHVAGQAAARAALLGGDRDLGRDHGADRGDGAERRRAGRLVGRAVPLAFLFAAIAIALISYSFVRLTALLQPRRARRTRSRARRSARAPASSPAGRCSRTYSLLHRGEHRRGRALRHGLPRQHRHLEQPGVDRDLAGRGRARLAARLRRREGGDPRAALVRGDLGDADRDPGRRHLLEGDRRHGAERPELHAQAVRPGVGHRRSARSRSHRCSACSRSAASRARPRSARRRTTRAATSRSRSPAPSASAASSTRSSCSRSRSASASAPAGIKAFSTLERARSATSRSRTSGQRHGGRDQLRRDAQRVREPARLRRRRLADPLRPRARRLHHAAARRRVPAHRLAGERARRGHDLRHR